MSYPTNGMRLRISQCFALPLSHNIYNSIVFRWNSREKKRRKKQRYYGNTAEMSFLQVEGKKVAYIEENFCAYPVKMPKMQVSLSSIFENVLK